MALSPTQSDPNSQATYRTERHRFHEHGLILAVMLLTFTELLQFLSNDQTSFRLVYQLYGNLVAHWGACFLLAYYLAFSTRPLFFRLGISALVLGGIGFFRFLYQGPNDSFASWMTNSSPTSQFFSAEMLLLFFASLTCVRAVVGNIQLRRYNHRTEAEWFSTMSAYRFQHFVCFLAILIVVSLVLPRLGVIVEQFFIRGAIVALVGLVTGFILAVPIAVTAWIRNRHLALLAWLLLFTAAWLIPLSIMYRSDFGRAISQLGTRSVVFPLLLAYLVGILDWWMQTQPFAYTHRLIQNWGRKKQTTPPDSMLAASPTRQSSFLWAVGLVAGPLLVIGFTLATHRFIDVPMLIDNPTRQGWADARFAAFYHRKLSQYSIAKKEYPLERDYVIGTITDLITVPELLHEDSEWNQQVRRYRQTGNLNLVVIYSGQDRGFIYATEDTPRVVLPSWWKARISTVFENRTITAADLNSMEVGEALFLNCRLQPQSLLSGELGSAVLQDCEVDSDTLLAAGERFPLELRFSDLTKAQPIQESLNRLLYGEHTVTILGPPAELQQFAASFGPHVIANLPYSAKETDAIAVLELKGNRSPTWLMEQQTLLPKNLTFNTFQTDADGQLTALNLMEVTDFANQVLETPTLQYLLIDAEQMANLPPLPQVVAVGIAAEPDFELPESLAKTFPNLQHLTCPQLNVSPHNDQIIQQLSSLKSMTFCNSGNATLLNNLKIFAGVAVIEVAGQTTFPLNRKNVVFTTSLNQNDVLTLSRLKLKSRQLKSGAETSRLQQPSTTKPTQ